jgi:hypothetical protein
MSRVITKSTPTPCPKVKKCLILRVHFGLAAVKNFGIIARQAGVSILLDESLIKECKYCYCDKLIEIPRVVITRVQPCAHIDYEISYLSCSNKCSLDVQANNGYSKAMLYCALAAFKDDSVMEMS